MRSVYVCVIVNGIQCKTHNIDQCNDDSHQADNIVLTNGLEDETTKSLPNGSKGSRVCQFHDLDLA